MSYINNPSAGGGGGGTTITIGSSGIIGGAANTFLNDSGGVVGEWTGVQATAQLSLFNAAAKGLVPASGGRSDYFLAADGTWDPEITWHCLFGGM